MSYILDALKKIEHEKNKRTGPAGRGSISGDLFQERSRPASRAGTWKIVLLVVVASLVAGAGTWFVLQGKGRNGVAVVRPVSPPPPPVILPAAAPVVPIPVQANSAAVTVPPAAVPAAPSAIGTTSEGASSGSGARRSKKQITVQHPPSYSKQTVQTIQAPADIKLSGIAWQDERAARRVVINGFLLKEGAVVSGAKISEILADRVRFSTAAGQFEIKFDAVLPSEVKR